MISELELRSFHGLDAASQSWLNSFLSDISIVELDERVKDITVRLLRVQRFCLPDAITATSALTHRVTSLFFTQQFWLTRESQENCLRKTMNR